MAITAWVPGKVPANLHGGETAGESRTVDWLSDTIKVMLCTNVFAPNQDTLKFKSDVTNEVAGGGGYVAGGQALTNKTYTYDAATNRNIFDCDDPVWAASTITARYAVVYDDAPALDADKPVLLVVDFGGDFTSLASDFRIQISANGLFRYVPAAA